MNNILVTGGAGYIGSILVDYLLQNKFIVTVIDNFMYNQTSLNSLCSNRNLKIINSDVRNIKLIKEYVIKNDVIIPLAAIVGAPACNKDRAVSSSINKNSIFEILKFVKDDQWILMPTTNSAYGSGDINNFCDENSALNPISLYAKDKIEVEQELMKKKNAISLRLATVFGMSPRMRTDLLINDFVFRAFFDGHVVLYESFFKRNYIHIRDVSRAFLHCLNKFDQMKGNIFNVGLSNANLSKQQLCEQIKLKLPKFNIINNNYDKDPDQRNYIVSNAKIELTGFKTKYSIDDGIEELISGYSCLKKYTYGNI
jgi:nucleoside-diphosphate-sugar epimerase